MDGWSCCYRWMPCSLLLCLADIRRPPPQAACQTGRRYQGDYKPVRRTISMFKVEHWQCVAVSQVIQSQPVGLRLLTAEGGSSCSLTALLHLASGNSEVIQVFTQHLEKSLIIIWNNWLSLSICGNFVWSHINVHPQRVGGADVCDGVQRVHGSVHGGSCCGVHIEWNQTLECSSSTFQFNESMMRKCMFL